MKKLLQILFLLIFSTVSLNAQELDTTMWVTNGTAGAFLRVGNKLYVGGEFTSVGPNHGGGAVLDAATAKINSSFPRINGRVIVAIPDGKGGWYIGGRFNKVGNFIRYNLAHINADFSVDPLWAPKVYSDDPQWALTLSSWTVNCLSISNGLLYFGGLFSEVNGKNRKSVAAVDLIDGSLHSWEPEVFNVGQIYALAVANNKVYVGGGMYSIEDGAGFSVLHPIDAVTGKNLGLFSTYGQAVRDMIIYNDVLYISGAFDESSYEGHKSYIAALDLKTEKFIPFYSEVNGEVRKMEIDHGIMYIAGSFTSVDNKTRNGIAAIDIQQKLVTEWNPNPSSDKTHPFVINTFSISDNILYLGGEFNYFASQSRKNAAAVDIYSGTITDWAPQADDAVRIISFSEEKLLIG